MIEDLWFKNTVIYSLDLETFMDTNGDGVGDFEGLTRRLDYLKALGVGTLWLSPFQPTPNKDNGYDVSDFYGVDPRHGSSGDFVEFMRIAHHKGMKVIMDLVVNHVSDEHRWFQEARRNPESPHRKWFVWSKDRPADWNQGMVFPGVQKETWTLDKEAKEYYYHRFYDFQPDLNMDNPDVRTEVRRIMGFWLELGVAGFRVDAVPFIIETTVPGSAQGQLRFEYLYEMRDFMQWRKGDAILLGEANVLPNENREYFGSNGEGLNMMFNFLVNQHLFYALASGDTAPLVEALVATRDIPRTAQWGHFLRNHDELDLGRLTGDQRQKVFEKFGPEKEMQLYDRGIRRRLAPMLGDRKRIELAYSCMFTLPGTPVIRYGDEIGMGDDLSLNERDAVRTPMQWSNEYQGGFSRAEKTTHPVISGGKYGYERVSIEAQRRDPNSLFNWMGDMIRLRGECPEIGWGEFKIIHTGKRDVLAVRHDWRNNSMVTMHNFGDQEQEVTIEPEAERDDRLVNLMAEEESKADEQGRHHIKMPACGYKWYRVGSLDHVLQREKK